MPTARSTPSTAARRRRLVEAAFPGTTVDGAVDRDRLRARVLGDEPAMARLEAIVHPLVKREEERFLSEARAAGRRIVLLDIPLLFETGPRARSMRSSSSAPRPRSSASAC